MFTNSIKISDFERARKVVAFYLFTASGIIENNFTWITIIAHFSAARKK